MGRTPKAGVARSRLLTIRLTDAEFAALEKARGNIPRGDWIRAVLLHGRG